jgi:hypothetical protein
MFCARTRFHRYGVRRVPFTCFARPDSFSAVPRVSGLVFMFCAPELVFGSSECVGSDFHVLHARSLFNGYRDVGSCFHVLRSRIPFRHYRGRRILFSCFARPDSFLAVPRVSGPVFMFCTPGLIFGGTEGVGSRFHVLPARTRFRGTEGVGSRFHVLRSQTRVRHYRGRRVSFSYFARPDSFSAVPRASRPRRLPDSFSAVQIASGLVFMFCAPALVFGGTKCIGSRLCVLHGRTHFRRYRGRRYRFHVLRSRNIFRRYRGRWFRFYVLRTQTLFPAVPKVSGLVFMFCALGLIFGGVVCVGSLFHVLFARTRFRLYRGRRVSF